MRAACVATVSRNGQWIVCGCGDGKLRILDAESQTLAIETNDHHAREVSALDVSTDSSTVASGSLDGSVIVWSITGQLLAGPFNLDQGKPDNSGKVSSVRFSRCGRRLAGCTNILNPPNHQHGAVYILDIHDNQLTQRVVVTFNSSVTAISWSVDVNGQHQILAGLEESLAVIDPSHGESDSRKPIPGFRNLSGNGNFLVSGTWQDGVRFWDAATFGEIGSNLPSCLPLAVSPNNFSLVGVSRNAEHCLSIWDLSDILPMSYIIRGDEISPQVSPLTATAIHSDSHALGFEAIGEDFNIILSKVQLSPNPEVFRQPQLYASPLQRKEAESIISNVLKQHPPVLIDTRTGHLCYGPLRILTLEVDPGYRDLLSSIGERGQDRFRRGVETFFEYVMFSHKWDETYEEPSFHDVSGKSVYNDLDRSPTNDKLRKFCETVRETGHRWAWSDTCCINRTDPTVLNRAIVSMYRWYKESALTLALLESIVRPSKPGDLRDSVWMTRAWTLQELLAPRAIRFYDSEWKLYLNDLHHNHRDSPIINKELASAVSVDSKTLSAFHPDVLGVREKLRLASTRTATREEDIAYSLFGIFASDLQPHYGEGTVALGRLLEEIVHRSGDVTVLAWTGTSSRFNSCLPADIAVYKKPPSTVSPSDTNKLRTRVVELQSILPREAAVAIYSQITDLPKALFANRRLHLPCVIFAVDRLTLVNNGSQGRVYRASASILGDVKITTADTLPLQEPRGLLLVHPWIHDLLHLPASLASDDYTRALGLIARLGLKFSALLLQKHSYHGYKRVAADHQIVVQLPRIISLQDIRTEVLDVWDCQTGLL
ncbi:hypothetical protein OG21DRAFT_848033 [Imleria badia]|nr:hypothetical protein OG21DRAFT_848033 [Imleria badia]